MDDKQLAKLIKKNVEKANKLSQARSGRAFDRTLNRKDDDDADLERAKMFEEMRKREF